ncbi:hypothetical protein ACIQBJ_09615 [Kitasatospora sp. NPDC088391]|uniref:hypothetical protein n=1 Tax=Kitasatospora sp. NPDC088391 TaxID=3364074 RepID=UPI0038108D82
MNGGPATGGGRIAVRPRTAVAALVAAAALGLVTGGFLLPARSDGDRPRSAPAPVPASATASASAPPAGATGPVTAANLLGPAAFAPGIDSAKIHVADRYGDGSYANAACSGEKTLEQTLGGPGAHFRGLMTGTRTVPEDATQALLQSDQVAREVVGDARTPSLAQNFSDRLLLEEVPCQEEAPGHWVYGRTTAVQLAPDVTANWMGYYRGDLNTTGRAPEGEEPCGGIAVLRSGSHYGVLEVSACLGTAEMDRVVRAALSQL